MNTESAKQDLFEIKEVLDELKVKFFLVRGTLLGAIREKTFISSDMDMDLRMFARDWSPRICEHFRLRKFQCGAVRRYPDKVAKLKLIKRVTTDLMLEHYYAPDDIYITLSVYHYDGVTVTPAIHFKEDCFIDFLGKKFRIPNKAEDLLRLIYGDSWRIPVEEKIVGKSPPCQSWHKHWKKVDTMKYVKWIEEHPKEI